MDLRNARTWKNRLRPKRLFKAKLRNYEKNLRQKVGLVFKCYFAAQWTSEYRTVLSLDWWRTVQLLNVSFGNPVTFLSPVLSRYDLAYQGRPSLPRTT